ncbi:MAG TPA: sarcosine oxidase subunit gamma family protein [Stellaceae bacterium]|nr:sarcosine oxidase subunit gamma family protein [Stellaceae bacterium]
MADPAATPFDDALPAGCSGADRDAPGLTVTKRPDVAVLSLIVGKGHAAALARRLVETQGLALPDGPRYAVGTSLSAIGTGPGRWLLVGEADAPDALRQRLTAETEGLAAVADLSDALPMLRLSGSSARAVLAKGLPIDLHPRCFGPGDVASSVVALIPVHLWQLDEVPTYDVAVPRSMAGSFAVWLAESAAEFGLLVEP